MHRGRRRRRAARRGRPLRPARKALGVAGGDGSVAAAAAVRARARPAARRHPRRHAQPLRPRRRRGDAAGRRRRRRRGCRRCRSTSPRSTGRRSSTPRASAPTRRWSRRRDRLSRPAGQVAGADRGRGPGAAHGVAGGRWWSTASRLKVWILFVGNCCYTPARPVPRLAPAAGGRPARRPVPAGRPALRPHPRGARHAARRQRAQPQLRRTSRPRRSPCVSRSGAQQVAYDGEMGEESTEFRFRKRRAAHRLLLPHRLTGPTARRSARRSRPLPALQHGQGAGERGQSRHVERAGDAAPRVSSQCSRTPSAAPVELVTTSTIEAVRSGSEQLLASAPRRHDAGDAQQPDRPPGAASATRRTAARRAGRRERR